MGTNLLVGCIAERVWQLPSTYALPASYAQHSSTALQSSSATPPPTDPSTLTSQADRSFRPSPPPLLLTSTGLSAFPPNMPSRPLDALDGEVEVGRRLEMVRWMPDFMCALGSKEATHAAGYACT